MTQQHAHSRGRDLIGRWCTLAERRLDYLTELFESGRWRRFHSEADFLDNIREAKLAVDRWRRLATQEAGIDNQPVTYSWLDRAAEVPLYQGSVLHEETRPSFLDALSRPAESPAPSPVLQRVMAAMEQALEHEPAPSQSQVDDHWRTALDPQVLLDRYPMLRSAVLTPV